MSGNPFSLTPSQVVWGAFYAALHQEVEKLTALERHFEDTPTDSAILAESESAGAEAKPMESTRLAHGTRASQAEQTGVSK